MFENKAEKQVRKKKPFPKFTQTGYWLRTKLDTAVLVITVERQSLAISRENNKF